MSALQHLSRLEALGLMRIAATEPEIEYFFRHALVQDSAYLSLLKSDRRALHHAAGEALERLFPERLDELAAQLGRHFFEAGEDARAEHYFTLAGDADLARYANAEAAENLACAIEAAERSGGHGGAGRVDLYQRCGRALELAGRFPEALAHYETMQARALEQGDRALELGALIALATIQATPTPVNNPAQAEILCNAALALAKSLGDQVAEARILWNQLLLYRHTKNEGQAIVAGEQAIALARSLDRHDLLAYALNDIGGAYLNNGQVDQALAALDEARELWRRLGNLAMLADNLSSAATTYMVVGAWDQAIAAAEEAARISRLTGNLWGQSNSGMTAGQLYAQRGDLGRGIATLQEAVRLGREGGFPGAEVGASSYLAVLYGNLGDISGATSEATHSIAMARAKLPLWLPVSLAALAYATDLAGDHARAAEVLAEARSVLDISDRYFSLVLAFAESKLAYSRGDLELTLATTAGAMSAFPPEAVNGFLAELLLLQARVFRAQERTAEAHVTLDRARGMAEHLGARPILWPVLVELALLADQAGDAAAAHTLRRSAREHVDYIAAHAGTPEHRASFLALPEVQALVALT